MSPPRLPVVDEEQPLVAREHQPRSYDTTSATNTTADDSSVKVKDGDDDLTGAAGSSTTSTTTSSFFFTKGHVLLFIVSILYGTLNVCFRGIYALPKPPSASALSTVRGWLAVLCFAPLLMGQTNNKENTSSTTSGSRSKTTTASAISSSSSSSSTLQLWKVAAELALWNFGAQGLINVGLLYIESARASFLTQLSVVMTPCLAALCGHSIERNVWFACAFALAGLVIMSKKQHHIGGILDHDGPLDHGHGEQVEPAFALGLGDVLCLCGALSWSTYLFRLSAVGHLYDEIQLQAVKTLLLAVLYSIWCSIEVIVMLRQGGESWSPWPGWNTSLVAWALLFYSALGPGTVADVLQQQGQSHVTATVANIILSLEPVFTALFGRMLLGELTTGMEKVGGCLILTAAVVATLKK